MDLGLGFSTNSDEKGKKRIRSDDQISENPAKKVKFDNVIRKPQVINHPVVQQKVPGPQYQVVNQVGKFMVPHQISSFQIQNNGPVLLPFNQQRFIRPANNVHVIPNN